MKTTNATFLAKQASPLLRPDYRVELLEQFAGAITDRDSATQIKISGDATDLLALGDRIVIPLADFETEYIITTAPSYASSKTTIICSAASFPATGLPGLFVAKRRDVTAHIIERGVSNIRISTEGTSLNSSYADDVTVVLDNSDDLYYSADGSSGIFNSGNFFWVKIFFFLQNDPTEFLCFGGLIYLSSVKPLEHKMVEFVALGHLKEMERYPGWYNTTQLGDPVLITGIELLEVTDATYEGRRALKFKFPDGVDIGGLKINSVSSDTPVGFHVLKYQPPSYFQYDFGAWASKSAGAAAQTLTAKDGHTINVDIPANLDLLARQDLVYVENFLAPEVHKVGKATLQLGTGAPVAIRYDFERVLLYAAAGAGSYIDITGQCCAKNIFVSSGVFATVNDTLWIMSSEPFYGIEFELDSNLVADFVFQYSTKYGTWATLAKTDGTSDFSQSGTLTWAAPNAWRRTNAEINSVAYEDYYFIKITMSAYTSGACNIIRMLRHFRLIDADGVGLGIKTMYEEFPAEDRDDEIVLVDAAGTMYPHVWPAMQSFQAYLEGLLDAAEYTSSYRTLDDLEITSASKIISYYGPPPKPFYPKKPTAICVDGNDPETIYLGIEDEVWKVTETGGFEYLFTLAPYYKSAPVGYEEYKKVKIVRLAYDTSGDTLHGVAVGDYEEFYYGTDQNFRRPAVVFRSSDLATCTEQNQVDYSGYPAFVPGTRLFRMGSYTGATYENCIGQSSTGPVQAGENICIPFRQLCFITDIPTSLNSVLYDVNTLTGNTLSGAGRVAPTQYKLFYLPPGYYFCSDNAIGNGDIGNIGFAFTLGQKGVIQWDPTLQKWIFLWWDGTNERISCVDYAGTVSVNYALTDEKTQLLASCLANANNLFYLAYIVWDEAGGTFPSDLSDCVLASFSNLSSGTLTTLFAFASDACEANQSLAASTDEKYCTILDMVYNNDEVAIHGCLLNRNDLTYHYFVYDVTNDKLYTTQTGTGFTFKTHRQIKEFNFLLGGKVYSVVTDPRYDEDTAYIISATFTRPVGAATGAEITLTYEADIKAGETDVVAMLINSNGRLYGITGNKDNYLFQYDSTFYPRFFLANTGDDNFRTVLDELGEAMNMVHSIGPDRKIHFINRDSNKGAVTLAEAAHYSENSLKPLEPWSHIYDGVEVDWQDSLSGAKGTERAGDFGFNRRVLKITNYFIQYPQLAALLAGVYYDYFSTPRRVIEFKSLPLWQIDNRDKLVLAHQGDFDFDMAEEWIISDLELDMWNHELTIKGVEK